MTCNRCGKTIQYDETYWPDAEWNGEELYLNGERVGLVDHGSDDDDQEENAICEKCLESI